MVLNDKQIMKKIEKYLEAQTEDKTGGSGHLSSVSIREITIDETKKTGKQLEVTFSYIVDIISEFSVVEESNPSKEPDPDDPYHYRKTEKITLEP